MGNGRPCTSYNIMNITMLQPHTLKVESIGTTKSGRGMEGDENVIEEGIRESFASGEGDAASQASEMRNRSSFAKAGMAHLLVQVNERLQVEYQLKKGLK